MQAALGRRPVGDAEQREVGVELEPVLRVAAGGLDLVADVERDVARRHVVLDAPRHGRHQLVVEVLRRLDDVLRVHDGVVAVRVPARERVGAQRLFVGARELGPQQAAEHGAAVAEVRRRLGRRAARKVDDVVAAVGAAVHLDVAGAVDEVLLVQADVVALEVERLADLLHDGVDGRVGAVHRAPAVGRAVDDGVVRDRQHGHGEHAEALVVDEAHHRVVQLVLERVPVAVGAEQLARHRLDRLLVARLLSAEQIDGPPVELGNDRVGGELEQNAVVQVLVAARHAADVNRLDGARVGRQRTLGYDEAPVDVRRLLELLRERGDLRVLLVPVRVLDELLVLAVPRAVPLAQQRRRAARCRRVTRRRQRRARLAPRRLVAAAGQHRCRRVPVAVARRIVVRAAAARQHVDVGVRGRR